MKNKNKYIGLLAVICALLVCGVGYTVWKDQNKDNKKEETPSSSDNKVENSDTVVVDGVEYQLNTNIQTVLFMGIDKEAKKMGRVTV